MLSKLLILTVSLYHLSVPLMEQPVLLSQVAHSIYNLVAYQELMESVDGCLQLIQIKLNAQYLQIVHMLRVPQYQNVSYGDQIAFQMELIALLNQHALHTRHKQVV